MNGAESLVQTLAGAGVEVCFANPGTSEMHFVAALDRVGGVRCVLGLFEGVATGAADGYGRMADKGSSKTCATPSTAFEAALKDRGTSRTRVAGGIGCSQEVLGCEMPPRCLNPPIGPISASRRAVCRLDTPLT